MMARTSNRSTETVGSRLQEARLAIRVSLDQLARAVRFEADEVQAIEWGKRDPTDTEVTALADMLGRGPRELFQGPLAPMTEERAAALRWRVVRRQGGRPRDISPEERVQAAHNLRLRREAMGLTQQDVAERTGIAQNNVSFHENPRGRINVGRSALERYAELYRCKVVDLLRPPPSRLEIPSDAGVIYRGKWLGKAPPPSDIQEEIAKFERKINAEMAARDQAREKLAPKKR